MYAILEVKTNFLQYFTNSEKNKYNNFFIVETSELYEVKKGKKKLEPKKLDVNKKINNTDYYYYWLKRICGQDCKFSEKESDDDEDVVGHHHSKVIQVYLNKFKGNYIKHDLKSFYYIILAATLVKLFFKYFVSYRK